MQAEGRIRGALLGLEFVRVLFRSRRNASYRAGYRFEWLSRAAAIRVHHARPIMVDGKVVGVLLLSRSARALFKWLYEDRGKIAIGIAAILTVLTVLSGVDRKSTRLNSSHQCAIRMPLSALITKMTSIMMYISR